jgi:hypothetical protein
MGTDNMILKHAYNKPFTIRLPDRRERECRFQHNKKWGIAWYTEGSKIN